MKSIRLKEYDYTNPNWYYVTICSHNKKFLLEAQHAAPLQENNKIKSGSLGVIVRSFKSASSRQINLNRNEKIKIWQPNYYEHIVRNEKELYCIRKYIEENPLKWEFKNHFPENLDL